MAHRDPDELGAAEYEALAAFRYTLRRFLRFSEEAAQAVGLTPQQHQALLAIRGFPGRSRATVGELAERLGCRPHTASELVTRLEAQGLVSRESGAPDGRQVWVAVSRKGCGLLDRLSATHREELRRVGPVLRSLLARLAGGPDGSDEDS